MAIALQKTRLNEPLVSTIKVTGGPRRFNVEEYYQMAEIGLLQPDERVELIEGEIVLMSPQGPQHASSNTRAMRWFVQHLGHCAEVRIQAPIRLNDESEPEPDVVLALVDADGYHDHHPTPREILLVLEVSFSSLEFDRVRKKRMYAQAGIRQYCVLNLQARELEDYRQPSADGYRSMQTYGETDEFTLAAFPEITVSVADLLPRKLVKRRKRKAS
jgi:Uma2 family endonuclease